MSSTREALGREARFEHRFDRDVVKANTLRTCCLVVMLPCCVAAVASLGVQLARGFDHGIGPFASDWTGPAFKYSTATALAMAFIYRRVTRWTEIREREASRLGTRVER